MQVVAVSSTAWSGRLPGSKIPVGRGAFDYGESSQSGENPRDNPCRHSAADRVAKEAEMTREICAEQDPMAAPH